MKPHDIRELSEKEREDKLIDLQEEFFNLKFQVATGKIENPGRMRYIRRDIARIKTIQHSLQEDQSSDVKQDDKKPESKADEKKAS
jgi:large subunit ribosomal protein L29